MKGVAGKSARRKAPFGAALLAAVIGMSGCAQVGWIPSNTDLGGPDRTARVPVTKAALPSSVQPYPRIEQTLRCIAWTGVLRDITFVVGAFADSTGKINAVAVGATGDFIPQGGSASYITDALTKAGGTVVSTYFGTPTKAVPAQYAINGIFNSLDFGTLTQVDVQVAGVGPTAELDWAELSLTIQLDEVATRVNRQISMIQRPVRYTQIGATAATTINSTLVTGSANLQNQERLQLEAINGPIALGVADVVMKEFPLAREKCFGIIADLLIEDGQNVEPRVTAANSVVSAAPARSTTPINDSGAGSNAPVPGPFGPTNDAHGVANRPPGPTAGMY
jgi:hypothetical protein